MQIKTAGGKLLKPIIVFASQFGARVDLNPESIIEKNQSYYLLNTRVKKIMRSDFFYSGLYLGTVKDGVFFPSFNLLNMLLDVAINKVFLNRKAAWLFICGRDVFKKGITKVYGSQNKGDYTLVLNEFGECLGFGRVSEKLTIQADRVVINNLLDVGDFLRRENLF